MQHFDILCFTFKFSRLDLLSFLDKSQSRVDLVVAPLFAAGCALLGIFIFFKKIILFILL
jgi:hypothetical protein